MSDTDMKDNETADMMVFAVRPSEVPPLEASSRKRKPKTATTTGAIKKRKSKPSVQMIEGPERQQLLSPLPTSPVIQPIYQQKKISARVFWLGSARLGAPGSLSFNFCVISRLEAPVKKPCAWTPWFGYLRLEATVMKICVWTHLIAQVVSHTLGLPSHAS